MAKLEFPLDKIKIVENIEKDPQGKFLLTKGGKPSVVLVNAGYLEKLIGEKPVSVEEPRQQTAAPSPLPAQSTPTQNPTQAGPSAPTTPTTPQPPMSGEQEKTIPPQYPAVKPR
jgi:hypothetical protein